MTRGIAVAFTFQSDRARYDAPETAYFAYVREEMDGAIRGGIFRETRPNAPSICLVMFHEEPPLVVITGRVITSGHAISSNRGIRSADSIAFVRFAFSLFLT